MKSKQFEEDAAVKVHRIRITLTSRNVKNLEKGVPATSPAASLPLPLLFPARLPPFPRAEMRPPRAHSLRRSHQGRQGQASQGERAGAPADQGAPHYDAQVAVWRGH